jgi:hypothetical protein
MSNEVCKLLNRPKPAGKHIANSNYRYGVYSRCKKLMPSETPSTTCLNKSTSCQFCVLSVHNHSVSTCSPKDNFTPSLGSSMVTLPDPLLQAGDRFHLGRNHFIYLVIFCKMQLNCSGTSSPMLSVQINQLFFSRSKFQNV